MRTTAGFLRGLPSRPHVALWLSQHSGSADALPLCGVTARSPHAFLLNIPWMAVVIPHLQGTKSAPGVQHIASAVHVSSARPRQSGVARPHLLLCSWDCGTGCSDVTTEQVCALAHHGCTTTLHVQLADAMQQSTSPQPQMLLSRLPCCSRDNGFRDSSTHMA